MDATAADPNATAAPAMTKEGVALAGKYPLNLRLRAEALATDGKAKDPDGLASDELIASTKDRLDRERAEAERLAARDAKEHPPVSESMKREDLVALAAKEGAPHDADATKPQIIEAIEATRLANKEA